MAASVATPLERQFSGIAELTRSTRQTRRARLSITLQFNLSCNIDAAAQDVQTGDLGGLAATTDGMPSPPSLRKVNPADSPILFLSLNSQVLPLARLMNTRNAGGPAHLDGRGVSQVQVYGRRISVRVQVDPAKLADRGIGIDQVNAAITNGNPNTAVGTLYGKTTTSPCRLWSTVECGGISTVNRCLSQRRARALQEVAT